MNGIHDMGGMHGMGPIRPEKNEPVFHARWEGRVLAMIRAIGATGRLRGASRPSIESIPPVEYLRMSYYERFFAALIDRMIASDMVTRAEVNTGKPATGSAKAVPALRPGEAALLPFRVAGDTKAEVVPRFHVGQRVRARNMHPVSHTRLPRYARAKVGTIEQDHGVFNLPDTSVYSLGDKAQHVYSVRFAARELWGEEASPRDAVYIDMWDDYLEPA
jgi:nitrile hydratase beta subunit